MSDAVIVASSALCGIGRGTEQVWASVRAGISRISNSAARDSNSAPIRMCLVPEDALEPALPPEIDALPWPARARRLLRLGAPILRAVAPAAGEPPVRLFLGLPELSAKEAPWIRSFALHLGKLAGAPLDAPESRVVPTGRASVFAALELALEALKREPTRRVIVGGIDTFFDMRLLASLDQEQRLLGENVMDGFIPGEGAAFFVLGSEPDPASLADGARPVTIRAAATAADPGHRYGTAPARGEGLANALEALRGKLPDANARIACTFAGFNGESFDARSWGVAAVRHSDFFEPAMILEHPADCFGDTGAAAGALLTVLAGTALANGHRPGPALVWAASDGEARGCALLSV
ncbi:MAG TPA: hypothetical protein VIL32_14475 [Steroidobacteraceae bacterium]